MFLKTSGPVSMLDSTCRIDGSDKDYSGGRVSEARREHDNLQRMEISGEKRESLQSKFAKEI
jgi:hypothetical protein